MLTNKTVAPLGALKVNRAGGFVWKHVLELRQRAREQQIVPPKYVENHDHPTLAQTLNTLPIVGLGNNGTSTVPTPTMAMAATGARAR